MFGFVLAAATLAFMVIVFISGTRARQEQEAQMQKSKEHAKRFGERLRYLRDHPEEANEAEKVWLDGINSGKLLEEVKVGGSCPYCGSTNIQAVKKGFSAGKAIVGGAIAGPVGLAAGAIGSNKIERVCINCGKTF